LLIIFRYASNADYLTTDDLLLFLEAEQGVRVCSDVIKNETMSIISCIFWH